MNGSPTGARTADPLPALDAFERIGRDHALVPGDLGPLDCDAQAIVARMWAAYERHWRRFCGTRLDPLGVSLDHPARWAGAVHVERGAPVLVVGTGPSLAAQLPALQRRRTGLRIVTSARGADVLAGAGIVPDLVLIEHQTALDAQFSVNDRAHRSVAALQAAPLVGADARTPAALLSDVAPDRLFVPDPLPTWGLWPATAVALAVRGHAGAVGLLGVDLGRDDAPDPHHAPLREVLSLLAACTTVPCVDVGPGGAAKAGWVRGELATLGGGGAVEPLRLEARPWTTTAARLRNLTAALERLAPIVHQARETLAEAEAVGNGLTTRDVRARLDDGLERLIAAGTSASSRVDAQDALGVTFLPRLWRTPISRALGPAAWRPAMLACHEVVRQHEALWRRVERAA